MGLDHFRRLGLKGILRLLFRPADHLTSEGRSRERYRRATLTTLVMIAARISNVLTGILTVPITLRYLGEDLFGIWMVLISIVEGLSFYDFGIGVGLRNVLIECSIGDDFEKPRKLIINALMTLTLLACLLISLAYTVFPFIHWGELIKCKNAASVSQILPAVQSVIFMFALGLPISQLQNILNAYQRGYWGYLLFLFGRIFAFAFIIWCVYASKPLWLLAGGYVGIPFLVMLIGWFVFLVKVPDLRPRTVNIDFSSIRLLFNIGFFIMVNNLSNAMINACAVLLIANTIDAASSVPYSVTQRLLGSASIITMSLMAGISAAVGEAWYRRDFLWIRKATRRSEWIVALSCFAPLALFLFIGQDIIRWWTNSLDAVPSFFLLLVSVLFAGASMIGSIYSNFLTAINHVRVIAATKCASGLVVLIGGYFVGIYSQSPTLITLVQFCFGAFVPFLLFRRKIYSLISNTHEYTSQETCLSDYSKTPAAKPVS